MPVLKIQLNQEVSEGRQISFLKDASTLVASELSKPESYVMVNIETSCKMIFAGTHEPAAYLELKSIGLTESQTKPLSASLCQLLQNKMSIPLDRIYIEFSSATRSMWGWKGTTF